MSDPRHAIGFALAAACALIAYFVGHPFYWFVAGLILGGTMTAITSRKGF